MSGLEHSNYGYYDEEDAHGHPLARNHEVTGGSSSNERYLGAETCSFAAMNRLSTIERSRASTVPLEDWIETAAPLHPSDSGTFTYDQHDQHLSQAVRRGHTSTTTPASQRGQRNGTAGAMGAKTAGTKRRSKAYPTSTGTSNSATRMGRCFLSLWHAFALMTTCCIPSGILAWCLGTRDRQVVQAWREKMALCFVIAMMCGAVAFITFFLQPLLCPSDRASNRVFLDELVAPGRTKEDVVFIHGHVYSYWDVVQTFGQAVVGGREEVVRTDLSYRFPPSRSVCRGDIHVTASVMPWQCDRRRDGQTSLPGSCLDRQVLRDTTPEKHLIAYTWDYIRPVDRQLVVYNGYVLDVSYYLSLFPASSTKENARLAQTLRQNLGLDATRSLIASYPDSTRECLVETYTVGFLDKETPGCFAAQLILTTTLICILGVVLTRFAMAVTFDWFIGGKLDRLQQDRTDRLRAQQQHPQYASRRRIPRTDTQTIMVGPEHDGPVTPPIGRTFKDANQSAKRGFMPKSSRYSVAQFGPTQSAYRRFTASAAQRLHRREGHVTPSDPSSMQTEDPWVILFVTCYSEGESSIRGTIESLAATDYNDEKKLLFIVADGIITGAGESASTPDIIVNMIEREPEFSMDPEPMSYIAIGTGAKQHNMAKVYVGDYIVGDHVVPTVVVVKCGTPDEQGKPKPGNRGKRDSQLLMMHFFQRVTFDDRMTPLDYDLFTKIRYLMGVTPDYFEIVLMVDADTKLEAPSLGRLVSACRRDNKVIGLCGETRIENKRQSWVTAIQVFEYYISHHLGKAFESVFGGVTCLPGCFCMYRIKTIKNNAWVPILANPEIIQSYSQNEVDTLHKKNLLLLGEDRFLTTLMLKTFPKRSLIFVPRAVCWTMVPDEFSVLLSQRRRWINSTIHNLLELVLVTDLCGIFCFSMQFVIFLELIGTVVLPAAIVFTFVLIVSVITSTSTQWLPLIMLIAILGLPAVLIVLTTRKMSYVAWMFVYLLSLPIWNFVLPVYAFWRFDDFSWGATRMVEGESVDKTGHGSSSKELDRERIVLKTWAEWTRLCYQKNNS